MSGETDVHVVIIGAGHAGLATAACLKKRHGDGIRTVVLDGAPRVGNTWHKRYSRLHLHTPKCTSSLPYVPFPRSYPTYPSREQVRDYLELYANTLQLPVRLRHHVTGVTYDVAADLYTVSTVAWEGEEGDGADRGGYTGAPASVHAKPVTFRVKCVVLATGAESKPFVPDVPGRTLFKGTVLHSTQYKDGTPFKGKRVLVVGCGNSGGEISLCLSEHGALPTLLIRQRAVALVPRDDGLATSLLLHLDIKKHIKPYAKWLDVLIDPVLTIQVPNLRPQGVPQIVPGWFGNPGILASLRDELCPPMIDIGQFAAIKRGDIRVLRGELRGFTADGVLVAPPVESGGWGPEEEHAFDAVVLATGYDRGSYTDLLPPGLLAKVQPPGTKRPASGQEVTGQPGLYTLGWEDLFGRIALIGQEAAVISDGIAARVAHTTVAA